MWTVSIKWQLNRGFRLHFIERERQGKVKDKYCIVYVYLRRLTIHQKGRKINISQQTKRNKKHEDKHQRQKTSTSMSKVQWKPKRKTIAQCWNWLILNSLCLFILFIHRCNWIYKIIEYFGIHSKWIDDNLVRAAPILLRICELNRL